MNTGMSNSDFCGDGVHLTPVASEAVLKRIVDDAEKLLFLE